MSETASHNRSPGNRVRLRREAQPLRWRNLDAEQRDAFREIAQWLDDARKALDHKADEPQQMEERVSRVALISGERGTGKTSLLCSLKAATLDPRWWEAGGEPDASERATPSDVEKLLIDLRPRLVWLEALDMEMLPGPVNLLAAILARVDKATEKYSTRGAGQGDARRGLLDVSEEADDVLMNFKRLQRDIAVAWIESGGRNQMADPDTYATDVLEAERARLGVNQRIGGVLDRLAEHVFSTPTLSSPLFVLPVDDFDLNPERCLELLRLLRLASVPRLFSIVLGSCEIAESILNLKLSGEYAALVDRDHTGRFVSIPPREIASIVGGAAFNVVRKLLPPAQRITLRNMRVDEALDYQPIGTEEKIRHLLANFPIHGAEAKAEGAGKGGIDAMQTLAGLLTNQGAWPYFGVRILEAPPRHIADLWADLRRELDRKAMAIPEPVTIRPADTINKMVTLLRSLIQEDSQLPPVGRKKLLEAFERDADGRWFFQTDYLMLSRPAKAGPSFKRGEHGRLKLKRSVRWRMRLLSEKLKPRSGVGPPQHFVALSTRTAAAVVVVHDLMMLDSKETVLGDPPADALNPTGWVTAEWEVSGAKAVGVPWAEPAWPTFWEFDGFANAWEANITQVHHELLKAPDHAPEVAAFCFFSAALRVATGDAAGIPAPVRKEDWVAIARKIGEFSQADGGRDRRFAHSFLVAVTCALAPEAGLAPRVAEHFAEPLKRYWNNAPSAALIRAARAQRFAAFVQGSAGGLGRILLAPTWMVRLLQQLFGTFKTATADQLAAPEDLATTLRDCAKALAPKGPEGWEAEQLKTFADRYEQLLDARGTEEPTGGVAVSAKTVSLLRDAVEYLDVLRESVSHPLNQPRGWPLYPSMAELAAIEAATKPRAT